MDAEQRLRMLFQNLPDYAIFTIDAQGFVTEWTEGAERVKGWSAQEIIGQHLRMFYTPEQIAAGCVERELQQAGEQGRSEREDWRVRKGGERFWGNEIATAMRDADGKLLGFTKITRDLTERKRAEDATREAEERYRLILENAREYAIFMTDAEGHILTWNTGAERIFGYAQAEVIGQDAAILFTPEDRAAGEHQRELMTASSEGRASDDRWQMRKGGERFFASGITSPLRDIGGSLRGFVKVCRDLTERRMLEQQRERLLEQEQAARQEAERAMRMRDEFIAVVSHELRTPLTSILLWAKMLQSESVRQEDFSEAVESIERSAEAQRKLIEDLLDVSSMMSGKVRLDVREVELAPIIQSAIEAVRPSARAKRLALELKVEDGASRARIDPDRIQQVIWNLLNNAAKFTDHGGISVAVGRSDGKIRIEVRDTGRGISPDFLPHVFERFRQADASITRARGGLGLGLSICRQLVELHGGTIRAESTGEGKGSMFIVELPLSDHVAKPGVGAISGSDETDLQSEPRLPRPSPTLRGVRILLVEDEENSRRAIQRVLEQREAEVTAVESAALAVAAFREGLAHRRYQVLVSDIGMPVQDGYELMREIREMERQRGETSGIAAAALTAYGREQDRNRAMAVGFQVHVTKPLEPAALIDAVLQLVGTE